MSNTNNPTKITLDNRRFSLKFERLINMIKQD